MTRPSTRTEPTAVGEIPHADPIASRLRSEADRHENEGLDGSGTRFGPRLYTLDETRRMPRAVDEAIIDNGILTIGGKMLVYAGAGHGKTTLLDHLAASLASGEPFLSRFDIDRPRRVLYVQAELTTGELGSHGRDLLEVFDETPAEDNLVFWLQPQLKLPRELDRLRQAVSETDAEILLLDPFIRFFDGQNTVQPEEVNALLDCLDRLLLDPDLNVEAVIVAHHMNVAKARAAGSWAFDAWPSTVVRLDLSSRLSDARRLTFEKVRSPDSDLLGRSLTIRLTERGYWADGTSLDSPTADGAGPDTLAVYLRSVGGWAWRADAVAHLRTTLNVKDRQATNIIRSAIRDGAVRSERVGRQARLLLSLPRRP